jgi:hypothetical protein
LEDNKTSGIIGGFMNIQTKQLFTNTKKIKTVIHADKDNVVIIREDKRSSK